MSVCQSVTKNYQPLRILSICHYAYILISKMFYLISQISDLISESFLSAIRPISWALRCFYLISHTIEPIDHQAYQQSSLSTIEPINHWTYWPLSHPAYWPSSLLTIKPIDHRAYRPSSLSLLSLSTIKPINHQAYRPLSLLTSGLLLQLSSLSACCFFKWGMWLVITEVRRQPSSHILDI